MNTIKHGPLCDTGDYSGCVVIYRQRRVWQALAVVGLALGALGCRYWW